MFRNLQKNIEHVGWDQEGFRTSFRANASGCVGSEHRFYYPVGEVEPGMLRTNFQHGLLILPGLQKNILFTLYIPKLNLILHNHSRLGRAGSLASKSNSDARHNFLAMLGPNSTKNQDAFFPHCWRHTGWSSQTATGGNDTSLMFLSTCKIDAHIMPHVFCMSYPATFWNGRLDSYFDSPPARWELLDFIRAVRLLLLLLVLLLLRQALRQAFRQLFAKLFAKLFANSSPSSSPMSSATSVRSGHCCTSTAGFRSEWGTTGPQPGTFRAQSSVGTTGPQYGTFRAQWAPVDLNPGPSEVSGHHWTSTWDLPEVSGHLWTSTAR